MFSENASINVLPISPFIIYMNGNAYQHYTWADCPVAFAFCFTTMFEAYFYRSGNLMGWSPTRLRTSSETKIQSNLKFNSNFIDVSV